MLQSGFLFPPIPAHPYLSGLQTGQIVAYVHSSGSSLNNDPEVNARLYTTLNAALAACRSARGDTVVVLAGHAENISSADQMSNLVAATRIVGLGYGTSRPTFTWTAATATFLFDVANTALENCILEMAGDPAGTTALSVAAPITVSAAGCRMFGCLVRVGVDSDQLATIGVTTTAAADDFEIADCTFFGDTTSEVTTMLQLVGADRLKMRNCHFEGATSSTTVGVVRLITTASGFIRVDNCSFVNRKAASIHAVTGIAAGGGVVRDCDFGILDDATLVGWQTKGNLMFFRCQTVNLAGETGAATTVVST